MNGYASSLAAYDAGVRDRLDQVWMGRWRPRPVAGVSAVCLGIGRSTAAWVLRTHLRWSSAAVGAALCYHELAQKDGDPALELSAAVGVDTFEGHVAHLARSYRVVPVSQLQEAATRRRRGGRMPLAITFDDDLPSHLELARQVLMRRGVTATFFLTGAGLAGARSFWWQTLQRAWDTGAIDKRRLLGWGIAGTTTSTIRDVASAIQSMPAADRARVTRDLATLVAPPHASEVLGAGEIHALASAGFEIGFHTAGHDDLVVLPSDALDVAMAVGRDALERIVGPLSVIAYPHGRADAAVAAAARQAGFKHGFTADGTGVRADDDPHLLGRRYPQRDGHGSFGLAIARTLMAAARDGSRGRCDVS